MGEAAHGTTFSSRVTALKDLNDLFLGCDDLVLKFHKFHPEPKEFAGEVAAKVRQMAGTFAPTALGFFRELSEFELHLFVEKVGELITNTAVCFIVYRLLL